MARVSSCQQEIIESDPFLVKKELMTLTVHVIKNLLTVTIPVNEVLMTRMVSVNNIFIECIPSDRKRNNYCHTRLHLGFSAKLKF